MIQAIKNWWDGETHAYENDPSSNAVIIGVYVQRHWTSRFAHTIWDFLKKEWKWVIASVIAIVAIIVKII